MKLLKIIFAVLFYLPLSSLFASDTNDYYKLALGQYEQNEYTYAIRNLESAIELDDFNWRAHQLLAYCDYMKNDLFHALEECNLSLEHHKDNPRLENFMDRLKAGASGQPVKPEDSGNYFEGTAEAQMPPPPDLDKDRQPDIVLTGESVPNPQMPAPAPSTPTPASPRSDFFSKLRIQAGLGLDVLGLNFNTTNRIDGLGWAWSFGYTLNDHWSLWLGGNFFFFPGYSSGYAYNERFPTDFYELLLSTRYAFGDKDLKLYLTAGYGFLKVISNDPAVFSANDNGNSYDEYFGTFPAVQFGLGMEWRWSSVVSLFAEAKENIFFPSFSAPFGVPGSNLSFTAMDFPINAGFIFDFWAGKGPVAESPPASSGDFFLKMGGGLGLQPYWDYVPAIVNTSLAIGYDFPDLISLYASLERFPGAWVMLANIQGSFPTSTFFKPYLFFGIGGGANQSNDASATQLALQLGCGVDFPLDRGMDLFVETKAIGLGFADYSDLFYQPVMWDSVAGLKFNLPETPPVTHPGSVPSSGTGEEGRPFVEAAWGFDLPAQNWQSAYTYGGGGKFCAGYEFKDGLVLQLDVEDFDYSGSNAYGPIGDHELLILPTVRYFFLQKVVRPYLSGGAGLDLEVSWGSNTSAAEVGNFDAALGAGVEVPLDDWNSLFAEGKYNFIFANGVTGQDLPLFAGARFGFE